MLVIVAARTEKPFKKDATTEAMLSRIALSRPPVRWNWNKAAAAPTPSTSEFALPFAFCDTSRLLALISEMQKQKRSCD